MSDAKIKIEDYMDEELSGEKFCALFPDLSKKLVKLTNESECHNGFQFKTGLNIDMIPFNPKGEYRAGGIYFTDIDNISVWLGYGDNMMENCRTVTLEPDCRVYIKHNKFKADKIILGEKVEISELPYWSDNDYCLNAVRKNIRSLKYIKDINHDIQIEAVKNDHRTIAYLLDKKIEISKEVQINGIKNHGLYIIECLLHNKVDIPKEVQIVAAKYDHRDFIKCLLNRKIDISNEVQIEAVKKTSHVIKYLLDYGIKVSEEVQIEAVKKNWRVIKILLAHKVGISKKVQIEAIKNNPQAQVLKYLLKRGVKVSDEVRFKSAKII